MRRIAVRFVGLALHLSVGAAVVLSLWTVYQSRKTEIQNLEAVARQEHHDTANLQREVEVLRKRLEALSRNDPYVVELLARDKSRLGYNGGGELIPPPLPNP